MRPSRALGFSLPLAAWLIVACLFGGGVMGTAPGARAQGSLTPLAGQPRATAPGGVRGRAGRRHRTHRHR
ncbi:hypothetical protein FV217_09355 [Methylobacterium sp. WL9]|uniref:Uncharacterized protein n=1 Tax=Methylobacterium thuringiense TaxID=1003091 RepID=A0ABQ4TNY9_9HYPH|nr:hypothetical protein FV217_09355 [Methylobacterium sp. WL9]GJE57016.1 hypothetical protein EKPJFOCH_3526 [Methylobacterium thuringiense]